jgi:hypothetical protein
MCERNPRSSVSVVAVILRSNTRSTGRSETTTIWFRSSSGSAGRHAAVMAISPGTVKSHATRALLHLAATVMATDRPSKQHLEQAMTQPQRMTWSRLPSRAVLPCLAVGPLAPGTCPASLIRLRDREADRAARHLADDRSPGSWLLPPSLTGTLRLLPGYQLPKTA